MSAKNKSPEHLTDECNLIVLDCITDSHEIAFYSGVAASQKQNFVKVFPWHTKCAKGDKEFIAIKKNESVPQVCGWASVHLSRSSAYVKEISTAFNKYKRIGTSIFNVLEKLPIDFIYLIPLDSAKSFYSHIGFVDMHEELPYMYKIVNKPPSTRFIKTKVNEIKQATAIDKATTLATLHEIADDLDDDAEVKLFWNFISDENNKSDVMYMYEYKGIDGVREMLNVR